MRLRFPRIRVPLDKIIAALVFIRDAVPVVERIFGKKKRIDKEKDVEEKKAKLQELVEKVKEKSKDNPIFLMLLAQLNLLLEFVAEKAPESAERYIVAAAQTVLIWVPFAEEYAATTETQVDDVFFGELRQAAEALAA